MSDAYRRIKEYAMNLDSRIIAREEWWRRNPEYNGVVDDWLVPESIIQRDPLPDTKDILPADRFRDILMLLTELWEKTNE